MEKNQERYDDIIIEILKKSHEVCLREKGFSNALLEDCAPSDTWDDAAVVQAFEHFINTHRFDIATLHLRRFLRNWLAQFKKDFSIEPEQTKSINHVLKTPIDVKC